MRSKLFRNNRAPSKNFSEDMDVVSNLTITKQILEILPKTISKYLLATDPKSESEALETLRKAWSLPPKEMEAVLGVGGYLLQRMEPEDSTDDIMADLDTLSVIENKKLPMIQPLIEALLEEYKKTFSTESLAVSHQSSGLKVIKGITHIVDFRPVVSNRIGLGEDITGYKPKVDTLVPVSILRIRLSGDDDFVFQMDRKSLRILKNELKAIDEELEEAIAFIGKEKITLL